MKMLRYFSFSNFQGILCQTKTTSSSCIKNLTQLCSRQIEKQPVRLNFDAKFIPYYLAPYLSHRRGTSHRRAIFVTYLSYQFSPKIFCSKFLPLQFHPIPQHHPLYVRKACLVSTRFKNPFLLEPRDPSHVRHCCRVRAKRGDPVRGRLAPLTQMGASSGGTWDSPDF